MYLLLNSKLRQNAPLTITNVHMPLGHPVNVMCATDLR